MGEQHRAGSDLTDCPYSSQRAIAEAVVRRRLAAGSSNKDQLLRGIQLLDFIGIYMEDIIRFANILGG